LLCIAVVLHALRAAFSRSMRHMLIWPRHLREFWRGERAARHTLPQKLMHAVLGFAVLLACVTGVLLLTKAYLPGGQAGETIHSLHRVSAIAILVLSVVHIVYYLLPGKRAYLRAMIRGQMTRAEAAQFHDPARWSGQRKDDPRG